MQIAGKMWPLVANLPQVTTTPTENLRIAPRIFEKMEISLMLYQGLGEDDSWKKHEARNLVTLSL
jgi:hypothetical protein